MAEVSASSTRAGMRVATLADGGIGWIEGVEPERLLVRLDWGDELTVALPAEGTVEGNLVTLDASPLDGRRTQEPNSAYARWE